MPRYIVKLTNEERLELQALIQKGGKGYRIRHAQILLKLDKVPENKDWAYDRITGSYGSVRSTIAGIAKRFVYEGLEAALGRKKHDMLAPMTLFCQLFVPPKPTSRWLCKLVLPLNLANPKGLIMNTKETALPTYS